MTTEPKCLDYDTDGIHCEGPIVVGLCDQHADEWAQLLHERGKQRRDFEDDESD